MISKRPKAYRGLMIIASNAPNVRTLSDLRSRLAPAQQPVLDKLGPQDQVLLLDSLKAAEAGDSKAYFDSKANEQDKSNYYGDLPSRLDKLNPQQLYKELNQLVSRTHTKELDYKPSQYLYPVVDKHPDGQLRSIYAGENSPGIGAAALIADDFKREAERAGGELHYNCEHVVPQSWFAKKSPMRGDLHHLFACDVKCNSDRANAVYKDFPETPEGNCGITTPQHTHFEPANGKGEVARATLYFLLRYPGQIGDQSGEYTAGDLQMLLKWHKEDPPNTYEMHRNAEIALEQGNRNPLIDHPDWADKIDFKSGLGAAGRAQRRMTLAPNDYIVSCSLGQPFDYVAR